MPKHPEITTNVYEGSFNWLQDNINELPSKSELSRYRPDENWFKSADVLHNIHGIGHETRVLVLQELLTRITQTRNPGLVINNEALRWSSVSHDTQRISDTDDLNHGIDAGLWTLQADSPIPDDLKNEVSYLNSWHVPPDSQAPAMTLELAILKDADCLDRMRTPEDFDPRFLRLPGSVALIPIAQKLYIESSSMSDYGNGKSFDCVLNAAANLGIIH